jgi:hypothetical protein
LASRCWPECNGESKTGAYPKRSACANAGGIRRAHQVNRAVGLYRRQSGSYRFSSSRATAFSDAWDWMCARRRVLVQLWGEPYGVGCLLLLQEGKRELDGMFLLRRQIPLFVECFFGGVGRRRYKFAETRGQGQLVGGQWILAARSCFQLVGSNCGDIRRRPSAEPCETQHRMRD